MNKLYSFSARLLRTKALLDAVIESDTVSDDVIGFYCQQAAEKMLKALLSDLGTVFHKTHELGALMDTFQYREEVRRRTLLPYRNYSQNLQLCWPLYEDDLQVIPKYDPLVLSGCGQSVPYR